MIGALALARSLTVGAETASASAREEVIPPHPVSVPIQAPAMPDRPAAGKGRMRIAFSGNRRWCTFPDDRLLKPPSRPGRDPKSERKEGIYTFGYQFTIAAVARGAPAVPIILYESPVYRTASLLPAVKVGRGEMERGPRVGPSIGAGPEASKTAPGEGPATLVPVWQEEYRCTTLPDHFDFDLDPGTYDVYLAFDVMNRQGGWFHRSSGFQTDVTVEAGRSTLLEAIASFQGAAREFDLQGARLLPEAGGPEIPGP